MKIFLCFLFFPKFTIALFVDFRSFQNLFFNSSVYERSCENLHPGLAILIHWKPSPGTEGWQYGAVLVTGSTDAASSRFTDFMGLLAQEVVYLRFIKKSGTSCSGVCPSMAECYICNLARSAICHSTRATWSDTRQTEAQRRKGRWQTHRTYVNDSLTMTTGIKCRSMMIS